MGNLPLSVLLIYFLVLREASPEKPVLTIFSKRNELSDSRLGVFVRRINDSLELTCEISHNGDGQYDLNWIYHNRSENSPNHYVSERNESEIVLSIKQIKSEHEGKYVCCASRNGIVFNKTIELYVKGPASCVNKFDCLDRCIPLHNVCDGVTDCPNESDESPSRCGENPCAHGKYMCNNNRCIPDHWCCLPSEANCSVKNRHSCCPKITRGYEYMDQEEWNLKHYNDMTFLQTTIYTVIGCAMVFMLIVTILVIAICRVHVRRTLLSSIPSRHRTLNSTAYHRAFTQDLGSTNVRFCDLDLYLNRSEGPGLLVTYNINNGVQIVGDPVEPPPYSEVVAFPPREGPPPPYVPRMAKEDDEDQEAAPCLNQFQRERFFNPSGSRSLRHGLSNVHVSSEPALSSLR